MNSSLSARVHIAWPWQHLNTLSSPTHCTRNKVLSSDFLLRLEKSILIRDWILSMSGKTIVITTINDVRLLLPEMPIIGPWNREEMPIIGGWNWELGIGGWSWELQLFGFPSLVLQFWIQHIWWAFVFYLHVKPWHIWNIRSSVVSIVERTPEPSSTRTFGILFSTSLNNGPLDTLLFPTTFVPLMYMHLNLRI